MASESHELISWLSRRFSWFVTSLKFFSFQFFPFLFYPDSWYRYSRYFPPVYQRRMDFGVRRSYIFCRSSEIPGAELKLGSQGHFFVEKSLSCMKKPRNSSQRIIDKNEDSRDEVASIREVSILRTLNLYKSGAQAACSYRWIKTSREWLCHAEIDGEAWQGFVDREAEKEEKRKEEAAALGRSRETRAKLGNTGLVHRKWSERSPSYYRNLWVVQDSTCIGMHVCYAREYVYRWENAIVREILREFSAI